MTTRDAMQGAEDLRSALREQAPGVFTESQLVDMNADALRAELVKHGSQSDLDESQIRKKARKPITIGGDNGSAAFNPKPHRPLTPGVAPSLESWKSGHTHGDKLVLCMVGLPGRGKTFVARRLARYITFFHGCPTKVFDVGTYRRQMFGESQPATFFDPGNNQGHSSRNSAQEQAMVDMVKFMMEQNETPNSPKSSSSSAPDPPDVLAKVAIYDAANVTRERRNWITQKLTAGGINRVIFVENICTDQQLIDRFVTAITQTSPDYKGTDQDQIVADFHKRIAYYETEYVTVKTDENKSYIKVYDCGERIEIHHIHGFLPGKIVQFLMNLNYNQKPEFFLCRHGQSEYNKTGQIGGDSGLTAAGEKFALRLADFAETHVKQDATDNVRMARLWTSSMQRTRLTARHIAHERLPNDWAQMRQRVWRNLDEIYAGVCDGMTYKEIQEVYPDEFAARKKNKLTYRYPRGESYLDLIDRLEPIIHQMERLREPVLIVGHQAILRVLYCYFKGIDRDQCPKVNLPLHTVIHMQVETYGCREQLHELCPAEQAPSH